MLECWNTLLVVHPYPAIIVDREGTVVAANAQGLDVISERGDLFHLVGSSLTVADASATSELRRYLSECGPKGTPHRTTLRISRAPDSPADWIVLYPFALKCSLPDTNAAKDTKPVLAPQSALHCFISFRLLKSSVMFDPGRLVESIGLTLAEAELAIAIASGQTLREFAKATNRKTPTLRWHLSNALRKAGCTKQSDLVRVVFQLCT